MHRRRKTPLAPWKLEKSRDMRKNPTDAEAILWSKLRKKQLGVVFRRQAIVQGWILDNYCGTRKLCIEVDGMSHEKKQEQDNNRDMILLNRFGIRTLRVSNDEVIFAIEDVVKKIRVELLYGLTNPVLMK